MEELLGFALGWPKKDVMEPFALGFFTASVARSAALRLSDMLCFCFSCDAIAMRIIFRTGSAPGDALVAFTGVTR